MRGAGRAARAGRDGLRLVAAALERATVRWPRLGLAALGRLGAASAWDPGARKTPTAEQLAQLFGPMPPAQVRAVRAQIAANGHRNRGLRRLVAECGFETALPLLARIDAGPLLRLRAAGMPVVIVGCQQGPLGSLEMSLHRLGVPSLVGPDVGDAACLKEALETLRAGGVLVTQLDWHAPRGCVVSLLGRPIQVAREPASLARIAGARLLPVTSSWRGTSGGIEIVFHEPLPEPVAARSDPAAFEQALLESAAAWFDAQLRRQPGTARNDRVRRLLATPTTLEAAELARLDPRQRRYQQWERRWGTPGYDRPWMGRSISDEIRDGVKTGWLPPGCAVLDAGCGEGDVAAYLAGEGYRATGADVAEAALVRARQLHGERPGALSFQLADLCVQPPPGGPFAAVIDRGCFLQMSEAERTCYASLLSASCTPDARLLLYTAAYRDVPLDDPDEPARRCAEIERAFGPSWRVERTAFCHLDRDGGTNSGTRRTGLVVWLRRTPSEAAVRGARY